jgi:hypothetical protein
VNVPDYLEPAVGWRVWSVLETGVEARLSSLVYSESWPVRHEVSAVCRLGESFPMSSHQRSLEEHAAPHLRCSCGIHAARTLEQAVVYLQSNSEGRESGSLRVLGRVSVWGSVVEADRGWRASRAYPSRIFLPTGLGERLESLAFGLAAYGVPVELLDCPNDEAAIQVALSRVVDSFSGKC